MAYAAPTNRAEYDALSSRYGSAYNQTKTQAERDAEVPFVQWYNQNHQSWGKFDAPTVTAPASAPVQQMPLSMSSLNQSTTTETTPMPMPSAPPNAAPAPDSMAALDKVTAPAVDKDAAISFNALAGSGGANAGGGGGTDAGLLGSQAGSLRAMARRNPPQESMALAGLGRKVY